MPSFKPYEHLHNRKLHHSEEEELSLSGVQKVVNLTGKLDNVAFFCQWKEIPIANFSALVAV